MFDLDAIDRNILRSLSADGRISNIDLAGKVGLSPSACLRRVQELERKGVISGYPVDKQVWLKPGDKLVTSIEKIGDLHVTLT